MNGIADERGQSIMFNDNNPNTETQNSVGSTHSPLEILQKTDESCSQLAREIEALKGKPQRRYAAQQRFKEECRQ